MKKYITNSSEATKRLAKKLAPQLKGGEVIGLVGELGTGKTVFVQGLAEALGIKETVNSPTFVLMKIYGITPAKGGKSGIKHLVHIDAYRLESFDQLKEIGAEEYLNQKDCLIVVEWADKVPEIRKYPKYKEVTFKEGKSLEERVISIQ